MTEMDNQAKTIPIENVASIKASTIAWHTVVQMTTLMIYRTTSASAAAVVKVGMHANCNIAPQTINDEVEVEVEV